MKSFKTYMVEQEHKLVNSFDDVEHEKPVRIQAFHGTSSGHIIKQHGFRSDKEVQKHGFADKMAGTFKHSQGEGNKVHLLGQGVYFADSKHEAGKYGEVHKIEVTLHKPYVIHHGSIDTFRNLDHEALKSQGYDGIVCKSGRYGIFGGENYRQGVAFRPHNVRVVEKHQAPTGITIGAKVKHKETGETGTIKGHRTFSADHLEWRRNNGRDDGSTHYLSVKWNGVKKHGTKARTDHNVLNNQVHIQ